MSTTDRTVSAVQKLRTALETGQYQPQQHFTERAAERGFTIGDAVQAVLHSTVMIYRPPCSCPQRAPGRQRRGRWVIVGPTTSGLSARVLWVALLFGGEQPVVFVTGWFDELAWVEQEGGDQAD